MSTQRTRDRTATAEPKSNQCPECDGDASQDGHEIICDECGLILDEDKIDHGPEWRAFSEEEREEAERTGNPLTLAIHDRGLSTEIGSSKTDANGNRLTQSQQEQVRRWKRQEAWSVSEKDRALRKMFSEAHRMKSELDLHRNVLEEAALIIRRAHDEGVVKGRSFEGITSAAILIGSRLTEYPLTLVEVTEKSRVEQSKIRGSMRRLRRDLDLKIPVLNPSDIVYRLVEDVRGPVSANDDFYEFRRCVEYLIDEVEESGAHSGASPRGIIGGAIYVVAKKRGMTGRSQIISQHYVANKIGVTEITIREWYKEIEDEIL